MMKVLVIGGGGREHALVWRLSRSSRVKKIFCAPGNAGIAEIAECVSLKVDDLPGLLSFARKESVDLTVVGPELPLTLGIADLFTREGLPVFGPSQKAAVMEGSKAWTKRFLRECAIPTAHFEVFEDFERAVDFLNTQSYPVVIKADGLAAGKGVVIAQDRAEAVAALDASLKKAVFGEAGRTVVIEEFLRGEEASFLAFVDGLTALPLDSSQDHKRIFDGDQGPNTGGMGVYSPAPLVTEDVRRRAMDEIIGPTLKGLQKMGIEYKGVLYAGLMVDAKGNPKLLEYNVRFGDPETQALMIRLESDLVDAMEAAVSGRLSGTRLQWKSDPSVCVVMAVHGYPGTVSLGDEISGLREAASVPDTVVFHAGTRLDGEAVKTAGGRVLGVTSFGKDIRRARERAYDACEKIYFKGMQFRRDIGLKGIGRKI